MTPDQRKQYRIDRLVAAIKFVFKTQVALGKALGWQDGSYVGQMLRGERPIDEDLIVRIERLDPRLRGWFDPANVIDVQARVISAREPSGSTYLVGSSLKDTKTLPQVVQKGEVMQLLAARELPQEFCLVLEDDSMSPTHPPGTEIQFLRVDKLEEVRDVKDVVLAQVGNTIFVRHFRRLIGGLFELKPFNSIYPEFNSENVDIQVIAVGKRFTHGPAE